MATCDVIVIGAGSAGAVLAAGLSADPNRSVLLLEAGPDHRTADAPAGLHAQNFFSAVFEPGRIWPNLLARRAEGQDETVYVRGRGAGGSSSVNALCAIRGTDDDYRRWADELGCPGWGWAEMLDAFLRVEDDVDYGGDGLHGKGGPIPLSRLPLDTLAPLDGALREAMADLGYPVSDDYHALGATGVSRVALTLRDGRRVSTNDAYLEPARGRTNLEVRGDVLVDRILFDGQRATGVRGATGEEIGGREVIVCAGAIHSPAILLRSGVGVDDGPQAHEVAGFELGSARAVDLDAVRPVGDEDGLGEGAIEDAPAEEPVALGVRVDPLDGHQLTCSIPCGVSRGGAARGTTSGSWRRARRTRRCACRCGSSRPG